MNKFLTIGVLGLLVVGCVSAITIKYSNPTYQDGSSIDWKEHKSPVKNNYDKDEWNNNFQKFRNGMISKEDMKSYIGGCE